MATRRGALTSLLSTLYAGEHLEIVHQIIRGESGSEWRTLGVVYEATLIGSRDALTFDPTDNCDVLWLERGGIDNLFSDKTDHNYLAAVKGFDCQGVFEIE